MLFKWVSFLMGFAIWLSSDICIADMCDHTPNTFNCVKYNYNPDGDTFSADIPNVHPLLGESILIRILGIDTAEVSSKNNCERKAALLARQKTQEILIKAKWITLTGIKRDKYFRVLANVDADGVNLGQALLNENLAYPYDGRGKPKINWCKNINVILKGKNVRE